MPRLHEAQQCRLVGPRGRSGFRCVAQSFSLMRLAMSRWPPTFWQSNAAISFGVGLQHLWLTDVSDPKRSSSALFFDLLYTCIPRGINDEAVSDCCTAFGVIYDAPRLNVRLQAATNVVTATEPRATRLVLARSRVSRIGSYSRVCYTGLLTTYEAVALIGVHVGSELHDCMIARNTYVQPRCLLKSRVLNRLR